MNQSPLTALPSFTSLAILTDRSDGDFETRALICGEHLSIALSVIRALERQGDAVFVAFMGDFDAPSIFEDCDAVNELTPALRKLLTAEAKAQG